MTARTAPDPDLTFIGRSRLKIGSSLLALVILATGSIAFANGQIPGLQ
jgi:hypothetical protein